MPSTIHLNRHRIFGVNGSNRQRVIFANDNTLCHLASENVVVLRDIQGVVNYNNRGDEDEEEKKKYGDEHASLDGKRQQQKQRQRFICGTGFDELQEEHGNGVQPIKGFGDHAIKGGGDGKLQNRSTQQVTSAFCVCPSRDILAIAESDIKRKQDDGDRQQKQQTKKDNSRSSEMNVPPSSLSSVRSRITIYNLKTMRQVRQYDSDEVFSSASSSAASTRMDGIVKGSGRTAISHKGAGASPGGDIDGSVGDVLDVSFGLNGAVLSVLFQKTGTERISQSSSNGHSNSKRPSSSVSSLLLACWDVNGQSAPLTLDLSMTATALKHDRDTMKEKAVKQKLPWQQRHGHLIAFHSTGPQMSIVDGEGRDYCLVQLGIDDNQTLLHLVDDYYTLPLDGEDDKITCHCWLTGSDKSLTAFGTDHGNLLATKKAESIWSGGIEGNSANSIIATPTGFLVGFTNATFRQYSEQVKDDATVLFECVKKFSANDLPLPAENISITSMDLAPNNSTVCAFLSGCNRIISFGLTDEFATSNISNSCTPSQTVIDEGHYGTVNGIDTCIRKPLIITVGGELDHSVRIWDYELGCQKICTSFQEEPLSVSLHPSGLHALIGFSDKLRLVNILADDIRTSWETSIRMCKECRFSGGGNLFAASQGNIISIFNFITGDKMCDLRGHNNKVHNITWGFGDQTILSCDEEGVAYHWNVETGKRQGEYFRKGLALSCCSFVDRGTTWIVDDGKIMSLKQGSLKEGKTVASGNHYVTGPIISSTEESSATFVGTCISNCSHFPNTIRSYSVIEEEYTDYPFSCTFFSARVTHDDRFLVVADNVGCISILGIDDKRGLCNQALITIGKDDIKGSVLKWSEDVLVSDTNVEEKEATICELQSRLDEMEMKFQYETRFKDAEHVKALKEISDKYTVIIGEENQRQELVNEEKEKMKLHHNNCANELSRSQELSLQDLEANHRDTLLTEVERYQHASQEWIKEKEQMEEQRRSLIVTHEKYARDLKDEMDRKMTKQTDLRLKLEHDKLLLEKELKEQKRQLEDDIDTEIEGLKLKLKNKIKDEKEAALRYTSENGIMRKKTAALVKDIDEHKETVKSLLENEENLREKIKVLEDDIDCLKEEASEKDCVIASKNMSISRLGQKNQKLHKFKFVLDDTIKEFKAQVEPRAKDVMTIKEEMEKTDKALEHCVSENERLDVVADDVRKDIEAHKKIVAKKRKQLSDQEASSRRLISGLQTCKKLIQKPDELVETVNAICKYICVEIPPDAEEKTPDTKSNDTEYLERQMKHLKIKDIHCTQAHKEEKQKMRKMNELLLQEIRKVRESNRNARKMLQRQQKNSSTATPYKSTRSKSIAGSEALNISREITERNRSRIIELEAFVSDLGNRIAPSEEKTMC